MCGRCRNEMTPKRKLSRKPAKLQQHMIYGQVGGVSLGLIVGIGKAGYGITKALGDHQTKRSIKKLPKSADVKWNKGNGNYMRVNRLIVPSCKKMV